MREVAFREVTFEALVGKTLSKIVGARKDSDEIIFVCADGTRYRMYHEQDCCEDVRVEDVCGNIEDLIGTPIIFAEKVTNSTDPPPDSDYYYESYTWTFYKIATSKGAVTIRWFGTSNGYYSEEVNFVEELTV